MTVVADASVVIAALVEHRGLAHWANAVLAAADIAAPHLLPAEVGHALRRHASAGATSHDAAALAHSDLQELAIEYYPYAPFSERIWQLRETVSSYDAWYVALAEELDAPLATLDHRLARAPGPRCRFLLPEGR